MDEPYCKNMKMLDLLRILQKETDADHPLSTSEIIAKLKAKGISADRRSLPRDIECLNEHGYVVLSEARGSTKFYWVSDQKFCIAELRIIVDAIQALKFITQKKTMDLISKVSAIDGGALQAGIMRDGFIQFNTRKHTNESIYVNVSTIDEAVREKKRISFFYFHLNERHEREYRNEHRRYYVDPVCCLLTEDNYYLRGYSLKDHEFRQYRLDRMDHVEKEAEDIGDEAKAAIPDINKFNGQVFKMYSSEPVAVTLEFPRQLVEQIYDRFGEETEVEVLGDGNCRVTQEVQPSPTFFSWVFTYGKDMKIVAPMEVAEKMKKMLAEVSAAYDNMI